MVVYYKTPEQTLMRRLGQGLLWLGAALGAALGFGWLAGFHPAGWSWIMIVGFAKLAFASSLGLMSGGAICLRLARRDQERKSLAANGQSTRASAKPRHPA